MSINKLQADLIRFLKTHPETTRTVAERTGLSERWLYRFKSGKASPTLRNIVALWDYAQNTRKER